MKVCGAAQMRELDRRTIEEVGIPSLILMELAGKAVAERVRALVGAGDEAVVVLCGGGNNGGDGFVVARHLQSWGVSVAVLLAASAEKLSGDALSNYRLLEKVGVEARPLQTEEDLRDEWGALRDAAVIVDALLGTGLSKPVAGHYRTIIEAANESPATKVAVDLPSGLSADTGEVLGVALEADHTVTLGFPKVGVVTYPGHLHAGELTVADIGIPSAALRPTDFAAEMLEPAGARLHLGQRPREGHKGTYGHLLLVAGGPGKIGSAVLAAEGALRSGAGLCTIGAAGEVAGAIEQRVLEAMVAPLSPPGTGLADDEAVRTSIEGLLTGKRAVALGPGLGTGPGPRAFVRRMLEMVEVPMVLDADGLNNITDDPALLRNLTGPVLVTPHPGEMSRLAGLDVADVQRDRLGVARAFAERYGVYLVLKGARSVIAAPDGSAYINPTGNAGMGTGGTGDLLLGMVGGLLAQGCNPLGALIGATYIHGLAGDRAAARLGQRSLLASDLLEELPRAFSLPLGATGEEGNDHPRGHDRPDRSE